MPTVTRDQLLSRITDFLVGHDPGTLDEIHRAIARELDEAGPDALVALSERLSEDDSRWAYYPGDPLAQRIHQTIADRLLPAGSALHGLEHITEVAGRPVVIFANHLSYSDANLMEILLRRFGGDDLASRLTAMAGPKVYTSRTRRFSSLCYGTIKTPQTSTRSSEEAVMTPRDVARAARQSIEAAHGRLREGGALVVFAEGARSRTASMQDLLTGAARYVDGAGVVVLPMGLTGTEAMFPIGDSRLYAVPVVLSAGRPFEAERLRAAARGDRRLMMDTIGLAIARLLPPEYRGVYGSDLVDRSAAEQVLRQLVR